MMKMKKRIHDVFKSYDYTLLFLIVALVSFGLVMVYSTTAYESQMTTISSFTALKKQTLYTLFSIGVMIVISLVPYKVWLRKLLINLLVIIAGGLSFLVLFIGEEAKGSSRSFRVGGTYFQPAEIVKIAVIVFMAYYLTRYYINKGNRIKTKQVRVNTGTKGRAQKIKNKIIWNKLGSPMGLFIICAALALPIASENLSSGIIIVGIAYIMCIMTVPRPRYLIIIAIVGILCVVYLVNSEKIGVFLKGYQMERINVWLDPESYPQGGGYQTLQALYAIGSGGLFGKGLGQSLQKLGSLPEAHNDMIFAIICEELGFVGALFVITLFVMLIRRLILISKMAPNNEGALLVLGVAIHICLQVAFNIAVVTNVMPNTGIGLPFISTGGTAVLFLMCEMAIVLSVSSEGKRWRMIKREKENEK